MFSRRMDCLLNSKKFIDLDHRLLEQLKITYSISKEVKKQFINGLIFHIDQNYKKNLRTTLLEHLNSFADTQSDDFVNTLVWSLSQKIYQTLNHSEINNYELLRQIIKYLKDYKVQRRMKINDYFARPSYTNNFESENRTGASASQVGELVETRINEIENHPTQKLRYKIKK